MGRIKKDFTLYKRKLQDGRAVWYYRTYTEDGRRTPGCSTGLTLKTKAEKYCNQLLKEGKLIPPKVIERAHMPTLREWAEAEHWWVWGECRYLRGQLARSDASRPAVSRRYADDALRDLHAYILPALGARPLDQITPGDCEEFMFKWQEKGYSKKTINNRVSICRIMLAEAARLGKIEHNPWDRVETFKPNTRVKGILSTAEARALLNPGMVDTVWMGNQLTYCASLLASVTACRIGEILALKRTDLFPDHIHVAGSYARKYGLGATKTKKINDIPIPAFVYNTIDSWCIWDEYIFSYNRGAQPAESSRINDAFKAALVRIGITEEERARRNITFHSWRHWLNTTLRSRGIAGEKVRQVTRHDSEEMTEHYSHFRLEDFKDVAQAQEELVASFAIRPKATRRSRDRSAGKGSAR